MDKTATIRSPFGMPYSNIGELTGDTLLDIGSGPTVYSVISASRHVREIHLSDVASRNRDILQKWRDGEQMIMSFFQYVLDKENDGTTLDARINSVRDKVTRIYPIDLRLPEPLPDSRSKYDIITACLSLNNVAKDKKDFEKLISKVASMMKEGGHMLIIGNLNGSYYAVGKTMFRVMTLNRHEVREALENNGLQIKCWKEIHLGEIRPSRSDVNELFFAVCRKM